MPSSSSASRSFFPWFYLASIIGAGLILVLVGLWLDTKHEAAVLAAESRPSAAQAQAAVDVYYQTGIVTMSVGCSVVATGLCSLLYHALIRHTRDEKAQLRKLHDAGFQMAHDRRELTDYYGKLIEACQANIDVLGWSFRRFHDSYADAILSKVRTNCGLRVRLLVVDPEGEEAKLRMETEGESESYFPDCFRRLVEFAAEAPTSIEVRKLDRHVRLPTMYFRIDAVAFVGPYFHAQRSNLAVTYELHEAGWLFSRYSSQFELLWDGFSHPCRPAEAGLG
jgi:hypothetical protein